jgi:hypothetical protein
LSIGAERMAFGAAFCRIPPGGGESLCASTVVGGGDRKARIIISVIGAWSGLVWSTFTTMHPWVHFTGLDSKVSHKNWGRIYEVVIVVMLIEHVRSHHTQFERGVEVVHLHVTTSQGFKTLRSTYEPWTDSCDCPRNRKQGFSCACRLL